MTFDGTTSEGCLPLLKSYFTYTLSKVLFKPTKHTPASSVCEHRWVKPQSRWHGQKIICSASGF